MSVADELNRLIADKAAIKTSIINKGVAVPDTATYDTFAGYIDQIQTGGGDMKYETVTITLSNSELIGKATVTVVDEEGKTNTYTFTTATVLFTIPSGMEYTVSYGAVDEYITPNGFNRIARYDKAMSFTVEYEHKPQPVANNFVVKYNVPLANYSSDILGTSLFAQYITGMSVDGGAVIEPTKTYSFPTKGEHTIEFIPSSLNSTPVNMFCNLPVFKVTSIYIPDNITTLGEKFAASCKELTSVRLSNNLTILPTDCFNGCSALKEIELPASLTTLGKLCLANTGLESIVIPDSVTGYGVGINYGTDQFNSCKSLKTVTLSSGLTYIADNMFYGCSALEEITIPANVTDLRNYTFYNCSALKKITAMNTTAPIIYTNTFNGVGNYGKLYHPAGSDYSTWMSTDQYKLGYFAWTDEEI